jgi:hypothetical protein
MLNSGEDTDTIEFKITNTHPQNDAALDKVETVEQTEGNNTTVIVDNNNYADSFYDYK